MSNGFYSILNLTEVQKRTNNNKDVLIHHFNPRKPYYRLLRLCYGECFHGVDIQGVVNEILSKALIAKGTTRLTSSEIDLLLVKTCMEMDGFLYNIIAVRLCFSFLLKARQVKDADVKDCANLFSLSDPSLAKEMIVFIEANTAQLEI